VSEFLHIVCLDAPSPPDYGGAIDMYYKIKAIAATGKQIILHYFNYNPSRNAGDLEKYCVAIHAYQRKTILKAFPFSQPFIVLSRINQTLINRLNQDDHPILLEGLHCSGILPSVKNPQRVILRMHNEEAAYYHYLAVSEKAFFKKMYFRQESRMLKTYQQSLLKDLKLACLSETDITVFKEEYGFQQVSFIPCFIPWQQLAGKPGKSDYCLYHGNLLVSENEEAAIWLINKVFSQLIVPLVIAGKGISSRLAKAAAPYQHIRLVSNPSINEIDELIADAHINVLPSLNSTGVKLKLLNALLNGRHCITNYNGIKGSNISNGVLVEDDAVKWHQLIVNLMQEEFMPHHLANRSEVLTIYNNRTNAEKLTALY
jgi:hypothetical protein